MTYEPFIVAQEHVDFLRENHIFFHPSGNYPPGWFKPGLRYRALFDLKVEPWSDHRNGPTFSALGAFSYSRSCFGADAHIGRYCAIGLDVAVMAANHPTDRVSMCGFDYAAPAPFGPYARHQGADFPLVPLPDEVFIGGVVIEPDVWIGSNALIARGVKIGTGAIIAANAVVTRDVAPYTLVAGNPARVKRRRFADELCDRLLASKWWDYPFDAFAGMTTTDPAVFLDQFDKAVANGDIHKMPENRINIHAAFKEITAKVLKAEEKAKAAAARQAAADAEAATKAAADKVAAAQAATKAATDKATAAEACAKAAIDKAAAQVRAAEEKLHAADERTRIAQTATQAATDKVTAIQSDLDAVKARAGRRAAKIKAAEIELARLKTLEKTHNARVDVRIKRKLRKLTGK